MTNPETPIEMTEQEAAVLNSPDTLERLKTGIDQAHAGQTSVFDLDAEFKRYQDRESDLLDVIAEETGVRKEAAARIAKARDELRMVRRLLSATKPRKPKS